MLLANWAWRLVSTVITVSMVTDSNMANKQFGVTLTLLLLTQCVFLLVADGQDQTSRNRQSFLDLPVQFTVQEEMPVDAFVGDLPTKALLDTIYDRHTLSQMVFKFAERGDSDVSSFVSVDSSGILRIKRRIDRDELCPSQVTCYLSGDIAIVKPSDLFQIIAIKLTINDINDNSPAFPSTEMTLNLAESTTSETASLRLPLATDLDSPDFGVINYKLLSGSDYFDLHFQQSPDERRPTNVVLISKAPLDRETVSMYEVEVGAYDGGSPPKSATLVISIFVDDVNDNAPIFVQKVYNITVPENFEENVTFVTVTATDRDSDKNGQIKYQWDSDTQYKFGDKFAINSATGEVHLVKTLDFETMSSYRLMVNAVDGGSPGKMATATVYVAVRDVNDSPPRITVNTFRADKIAMVPENAAVGEFVAYVSVTDTDGGQGGIAYCTLAEHSGEFILTTTKNSQYSIVTAVVLDRERIALYVLTIHCVDQGTPPLSSSRNVTVVVGDKNDNRPMFFNGHQPRIAVSLPENSRDGSFVGCFNASDADADTNAKVTYSIVEENARRLLIIDEDSGVVRTRVTMDYEKVQSLVFTVIAKDAGTPPLFANQSVLLRIIDRNDEIPRFHRAYYTFHVAENQPTGTVVGEVSAHDNDSPPFNKIIFSKEAGTPSTFPFTIGEENGKIYAVRPLDREAHSDYRFNIVATDRENAAFSDVALVHVIVDDVNDHSPLVLYPLNVNESLRISNRVPVGYRVSRIQVADLDEGMNGNLTFALLEDNVLKSFRPFTVLPYSGEIIVTKDISHLGYATFAVLIQISDHGSPPLFTTAALTVVVDPTAPFSAQTDDGKLLANSTMTVVAIISIVALILVACLLVTVVMVKTMSTKKRKQHRDGRSGSVDASSPEFQRMLVNQPSNSVDLLRSSENIYYQKNNLGQGTTHCNNSSGDIRSNRYMNIPCHHQHYAANNSSTNTLKSSGSLNGEKHPQV